MVHQSNNINGNGNDNDNNNNLFLAHWINNVNALTKKYFSQKILLEGQNWPLKTFFRGLYLGNGANKLKATEGKNASGYQLK